MTANDQIIDSPTGWVAEHVRRYVASDGADGGVLYGHASLLLTTRGRRSGQLRRTALYYGEDDGRYIVVASNGGAVRDPLWYGNIVADPAVTVQVGGDIFAATARDATDEEYPHLWGLMTGIFPTYDRYRVSAAPRVIPLVVIERVAPGND
jgi:deazaflavin-dependent oxidoreductase (nitroreductase family)